MNLTDAVGILRPTDYAGDVLQKGVHGDKPGQAAAVMDPPRPGGVIPLHRLKDSR